MSEFFFTTVLIQHPRSVGPGWVMAYVLCMTAGKFRNPVFQVILMKTCDGLFHCVVEYELYGLTWKSI